MIATLLIWQRFPNAAYAAAKRGDIPVIRIGKLLRVPKVAFDQMLERAGAK